MGEWPDKVEIIRALSYLLQRLSKLYQLSNWDEESSVILAEWIFDNYKFDEIRDVIACLKNPPEIFDEHGCRVTNWRLTPDTIQRWMAVQLEKTAVRRENDHNKIKANRQNAEVDYKAFIDRMSEQKNTSTWVTEEQDLDEFKRRMDSMMKINRGKE